jgi:hypothetical protein
MRLPAAVVEERGDPYARAYILMRLAIGLFAFVLPPLLVLVEPVLFEGLPFPRGSLSAYYYSGMREVYVGALWAIGFFLVVYKLLRWTWDGLLSTLAGALFVVLAVFPTARPGEGFPLTPLQSLLGEARVEAVHFATAGMALSLLAVISALFGREFPRTRAVHLVCTVVIGAAVALAAFAGITGEPDKALLFAEWAAVWAFAASWLVTVELDRL